MDQKLKFIQLRASGLSYDKIAKEINISKPTLIKWSRELETDIKNAQAIELDSLKEQYKTTKIERTKYIYEVYQRLKEEILKRDLSSIPTNKLIELNLKILESLNNENLNLNFNPLIEDIEPPNKIVFET